MRNQYLFLLILVLFLGCKHEEPKPVLHPAVKLALGDCGDKIDLSRPMAVPARITQEGEPDLRNYVVYAYMGPNQLRIVYHVVENCDAHIRMDVDVKGTQILIDYTATGTAANCICEYPLYYDFTEFPYYDKYMLNIKGKEYLLRFQPDIQPDTIFLD